MPFPLALIGKDIVNPPVQYGPGHPDSPLRVRWKINEDSFNHGRNKDHHEIMPEMVKTDGVVQLCHFIID